MKVSKRTQAAIESLANRKEPVGEVHYYVCGCCGHVEWASTNSSKERRVVVTIRLNNCLACADIYKRNPELVNWIMNVFAFQEMNPSKPDEES